MTRRTCMLITHEQPLHIVCGAEVPNDGGPALCTKHRDSVAAAQPEPQEPSR